MSDSPATRDVSWGHFSRGFVWLAVVLPFLTLLGGASAFAQEIPPDDETPDADEQAVARALEWLASHQMSDGGWSFNHHQHPQCAGKCANPGSLASDGRVAATALALLPFLGAGQTHKEGEYQATVKNGLKFLVTRMKRSEHGGSLSESGGRMYSHGLAAIALCEAFAMTHDKGLREAAQMAINFIQYAQDPVGGGWRYQPRQAGDTSVFAWQLAALKKGHAAYLAISPITVKKASSFLDSVQAENGAHYGYTTPATRESTTAIGLLGRMYLGWRQEDARLRRGIEWLADRGPSTDNMYYNYFANQAVFHHASGEGNAWNRWNKKLRKHLVESQVADGHAAGSWFFQGKDHGALRGGRLYCTTMACLILQTRDQKPIYKPREADREDVKEVIEILEPIKELEEFEELEELPIEEMELEDPPIEEVEPIDDLDKPLPHVELDSLEESLAPRNDLLRDIGTWKGTGLSGRGKGRGSLVSRYGGNDASEAAVARALKWLAAHQMPDGGWSFNHHQHPGCGGKCADPGSLGNEGRIAATALGLLPFLGAGQTHKTGQYKETVTSGLYFLVTRMKQTEHGGSLHEKGGTMYSHGLAAIVLCEAYAMTRDKGLQGPAQAALKFIAYAQDPVGGGWRYSPRQAGDTSVTSWQLMALKSGHMAYLRIPPATLAGAFKFLDSVQSDNGAKYGYTQPGTGRATTAIGLLCRMYMGWKRDNPSLRRGVEWLSVQGPSKNNMYYNYYATQVMRHFDSEHEKTFWTKWNGVMRDHLVESQVKEGHETGSWFQKGDHGADRGGRLYVTAMSTMILEVYYRHLPIYRNSAVEEDFPE